MKSVVISGGDGFVGTHLTKYLIENGYEVFTIVVPQSRTKNRLSGLSHVHVIESEMNQYKEILSVLPQQPIAFFHFAWAGVAADQRNDFSYQMQNIELSTSAVRLAAAIGAGKFIFPGSTMEYVYYGKPLDKNAIPSPQNAYGVAKISARYACLILCKDLNVPFIYTVISGIYSEDRNDNNVIYYTIAKLLHGEKPSLTRLEQLWDYVHIDDVVYGLQLVAEHGKANSFYALGHGDNWPLANYIYKIRDIIDPNAELGIGDIPYTNSEMPCSCVNLKPIYDDTGYVPRVKFEEGISRVISAVRKREFGG